MTAFKRYYSAFLLLALIALAQGCTSSKIIVKPFSAGEARSANSTIYYLPSTRIDFQFTLIHKRYTPGPYALYTAQFLGIQQEESPLPEEYRLYSIAMSTSRVADQSSPVEVKGGQSPSNLFLTLSQEGFLLPASRSEAARELASQQPAPKAEVPFKDLSSQPFIALEKSIFYTTVQQDTAFVRIPVQRTQNVKRSVEQKAREAAEQIFNLRRRRLELITAEIETPTAPGAVETMVSAIDRLEAEYLSLFIGRWEYDTVYRHVSYTPSRKEESSIPCRYTRERGIVPSSEISGTPLVLNILPDQELKAEQPLEPLRNAYYYRSPALVDVELTLGETLLLQGRIPLMQFGTTLWQPTNAPVIPLQESR